MYGAYLAAGLALALASTAMAADKPSDPAAELKSRVEDLAGEYSHAILDERARRGIEHARSTADQRPWDDPMAACRSPSFQHQTEVGRFMVRHTVPPVGKSVDGTVMALSTMNKELRRNVDRISKEFPPPGRAVFLVQGDKLRVAPTSWNQAVRQRAEWVLVLDAVAGGAREAAKGDGDFGKNYAAAVWTAIACDFDMRQSRFLKDYQAAGQTPDAQTQEAYAFLQETVERSLAP